MSAPIGSQTQTQQTPRTPRFSGNDITGKAKTLWSNPNPSPDAFIQGDIKKGLTRIPRMMFLRPRGYLELALHFTSVGFTFPIFLVKHFLEGFIGADSLIFPRLWVTPKFIRKALGKIHLNPNISGSKAHDGRTVVGALIKSVFKKAT